MKTFAVTMLLIAVLSFAPAAVAQQGECGGCAPKAAARQAPVETVVVRTVPGTNESVPVGRIENLIPVGVLTVLGCEKCAQEAVAWALQQGSTTEDIDRALRTVAAMQKLDCFKQQFGADVAARMEKPLEAARKALQQATEQAKK